MSHDPVPALKALAEKIDQQQTIRFEDILTVINQVTKAGKTDSQVNHAAFLIGRVYEDDASGEYVRHTAGAVLRFLDDRFLKAWMDSARFLPGRIAERLKKDSYLLKSDVLDGITDFHILGAMAETGLVTTDHIDKAIERATRGTNSLNVQDAICAMGNGLVLIYRAQRDLMDATLNKALRVFDRANFMGLYGWPWTAVVHAVQHHADDGFRLAPGHLEGVKDNRQLLAALKRLPQRPPGPASLSGNPEGHGLGAAA